MKLLRLTFCLLLLSLSACDQFEASPGSSTGAGLDSNFGAGLGYVYYPFNGLVQHVGETSADLKLIVGGVQNLSGVETYQLVRLNSDGSVDGTFGTSGIASTTLSKGIDFAIDASGKVLVLGKTIAVSGPSDTFTYSLNRYVTGSLGGAGALDTTFNTTGSVALATAWGSSTFVPTSIALQSDGSIIVAGSATASGGGSYPAFGFVRYTSSGALDLSFNTTGMLTYVPAASQDAVASAVAVGTGGQLVALGNSCADIATNPACTLYLVQFVNSSGSEILDSTFNGGAPVVVGAATPGHLAVQISDSAILFTASFQGVKGLLRYTATGVLDTTYGNSGQTIPGGLKFTMQTDDMPVIFAGDRSDGTLLERFDVAGALDSGFYGTGSANSDITGIYVSPAAAVVQTDGNIVVAASMSTLTSATPYLFVQRFVP